MVIKQEFQNPEPKPFKPKPLIPVGEAKPRNTYDRTGNNNGNREVLIFSAQTNALVFKAESVKEAAKFIGCHYANLSQHLNGTHFKNGIHGYICKHANKNPNEPPPPQKGKKRAVVVSDAQTGKVLAECGSIVAASKLIGCEDAKLRKHLRGYYKNGINGFTCKYSDEVEKE